MKRRWFPLLVALCGAASLIVPLQVASAAPGDIHPGVMTFTDGAQCTANFIFTDGANTYIGQAAHCSGLGAPTDTDGCDSQSLPLGTPVEIDGATQPGTLVYSSWIAMQNAGETNEDACAYNDFALVRIHPNDVASVSPTVPFWGGPVGINTAGTEVGDKVYTYGNSSLRGGVTQLSPKSGTSLGTSAGGWTHDVYTATPGIPGDSGSAFLDAQGNALGVLATVQIAPLAGSNGVGDLSHELAYAQSHGMSGVQLALGGPFSGGTPVAGMLKLPL